MKLETKNLISHKLFFPVYLILSSFIILWPVIFNGYPLFYGDSALYIAASNIFGNLSKNNELPNMSGIGYALFIRIVTWRSTLYLVVFAQALILNFLVFNCLKVLLPAKKTIKFHLLVIALLSLFSSMGWTVSQLMPDIFTSYLVLSVFLFFSLNKKSWGFYVFLSVIIMISILSHLTNITISVLVIGLLFISFLFMRTDKKDLLLFIRKSIVIVGLIFASLLILIGLNIKYYNYTGLSQTGNIFFIARLMDAGFMPEFLDEKCPERSYEMCKYKSNLSNSYEDFLWSPESEFNKTGGWNLQAHDEYKLIIHDVLTTPKYLGKFLYNCGIHSVNQLKTFEIGEGINNSSNKKSSQFQTVIRYFDKKEFRQNFLNSKQMQGKLSFYRVNLYNYILLFISIIIILWSIIKYKFDRNMILFTFITISSVIVNAAATSSLSSVFNRFQSRIIWMIPLLACVYFSVFITPIIKKRFKSVAVKSNVDS